MWENCLISNILITIYSPIFFHVFLHLSSKNWNFFMKIMCFAETFLFGCPLKNAFHAYLWDNTCLDNWRALLKGLKKNSALFCLLSSRFRAHFVTFLWSLFKKLFFPTTICFYFSHHFNRWHVRGHQPTFLRDFFFITHLKLMCVCRVLAKYLSASFSSLALKLWWPPLSKIARKTLINLGKVPLMHNLRDKSFTPFFNCFQP